ncbi:prepilin-type N-terminal cleavage/methylation domain-containing protein [Tautonia sp. JC769]|uniref:type IV pilus modification PilV family protein n=1 Tax=Tautonia sp. JC769 TaxID=3232135 RepID=UPI0034589BD2
MNVHALNDRAGGGPVGRRPGRARGGFTLIEASVAVVLLMVGMTATLQAVSWMARERLALDRHAVAIREAEHALDRLVRREVEPDEVATLSPDATRALPEGTIEVDRRLETGDGPAMERLTVTLRYRTRPGITARSVRLTTWRMPRGGTTAEGREGDGS